MDIYKIEIWAISWPATPTPAGASWWASPPDGRHAAVAYFIMGRSENSRNRVFEATEDGNPHPGLG